MFTPRSTEESYRGWFERFMRVFSAYQYDLINDANTLEIFQLFLLETGQFNASFTVEELDRLKYPKSPFAAMYDHNYLRATNTWAMQILAMKYREQPKHKKLYPIWIASDFFWEELERYEKTAKVSDEKHLDDNIIGELKANNNQLINTWWIQLDIPEKPDKNIKTIVENAKKNCIKELKKTCDKINEKSLKKNLVYYFRDDFQGIKAIVVVDTKYPYKLVNSLGYRADSICVTRQLLKKYYPRLFVDAETTFEFWEAFNKTADFKKLPDKEKKSVTILQEQVLNCLRSRTTLPQMPVLTFKKELEGLKREGLSMSPEFKLYAIYLLRYLDKHYLNQCSGLYSDEHIKYVANKEIKGVLRVFLNASRHKNFRVAVRATQIIAEVMQLDLMLKRPRKSFADIIKEGCLKDYSDKGIAINVALTCYAMRAFVRVLQILNPTATTKFAVTNQSYYELLENFEKINNRANSVHLIRHVEDIESDVDVIFMEMHPNNVVEAKQYAHDVSQLLENIRIWNSQELRKRSLVLDVTLNALNDDEVKAVLDKALPLIQSGNLNLVLIQSLTKFAQLGIDKRSAGCIITMNEEKDWQEVNSKFRLIKEAEKVDQSVENFFAYFFSCADLLKLYIRKINENVRFVYKRVLEQMNNLEILNHGCFQITMSSDPKACYVALNMRGLLLKVDSGFLYKTKDIEDFSADILKYLIYPLCIFLGLPLTARISIGFPLTSVNAIYDSLRFTIGLEPREQLIKYADILVYVAFVLNRQRDAKLFFELDVNRQYQLRINYFEEKVSQFKAMTPGRNHSFSFQFEGIGDYNSYRPSFNVPKRQLKRIVILRNGEVNLFREIPNPYEQGKTIFCPHSTETIYVPFRDVGDKPLSDVTLEYRRMAIACLTEHARSGCENHQNVNLTFVSRSSSEIIPDTVTFASMVTKLWKTEIIYGPFPAQDSSKTIFFSLFGNSISLLFNGRSYKEDAICIRQGNITIPLLDMPIEEKEFVFRAGTYEPDRSALSYRQKYPHNKLPDYQHIPIGEFKPRLYIENRKLIFERDFICPNSCINGITIYKRFIDKSLTCIEIDYWREKDPVLSRFLTLMTAVFVKDSNEKVSFLARDYQFRHFLFNITFEAADRIFKEAIMCVFSKKRNLEIALKDYKRQGPLNRYSFFDEVHADFSWPCNYSGVDNIKCIDDGLLIEMGLNILKTPELNNSCLGYADLGFSLSRNLERKDSESQPQPEAKLRYPTSFSEQSSNSLIQRYGMFRKRDEGLDQRKLKLARELSALTQRRDMIQRAMSGSHSSKVEKNYENVLKKIAEIEEKISNLETTGRKQADHLQVRKK